MKQSCRSRLLNLQAETRQPAYRCRYAGTSSAFVCSIVSRISRCNVRIQAPSMYTRSVGVSWWFARSSNPYPSKCRYAPSPMCSVCPGLIFMPSKPHNKAINAERRSHVNRYGKRTHAARLSLSLCRYDVISFRISDSDGLSFTTTDRPLHGNILRVQSRQHPPHPRPTLLKLFRCPLRRAICPDRVVCTTKSLVPANLK